MMILGVAAVGVPRRRRADQIGGRVSIRHDPPWFWWGMAIVGPPVAVGCGLFLVQPRWVEASSIALPGWLRLAGVGVGAAGVALFAWMFRHLDLNVTSTAEPREHASLVTSGPYRWVRHPMYSAALTLALAATCLTANGIVGVGGAVMFGLLAARSRIEEERLVAKFGERYRDYQAKTGRFLPRWRS
jgi:protein-S-isoprenylcysteine O-methyltransferase Ste14